MAATSGGRGVGVAGMPGFPGDTFEPMGRLARTSRLDLRRMGAAVAAASLVLTVVPSGPMAFAAVAARPYDFNGDGYPELAIGAPGLRVGSVREAGGVVILPASARGLSLSERVISQSSAGVPGTSETYDGFGSAVASADFDNDGYADLAIGQPDEDVESVSEAGSVTVIYGSRSGLNTSRSARFDQPGGPKGAALWGASLAAADLNFDGYPDLAVGAPEVPCEGSQCASPGGSISILSGGADGITSSGAVTLYGLLDFRNGDVHFGADLDVGDLDGDGDADLVVLSAGAWDEDIPRRGSVSACLGGTGGPHECTRLHNGRDETFGLVDVHSMAVGNMSGDALPEIVVGQYSHHPDSESDFSGFVAILHLSANPALAVVDTTTCGQDNRGVPGTAENGDSFGFRVELGDINRDGYADLVVGAPGENQGRGSATVVHGATTGWRTSGNYSYSQNTPGIKGTAEPGDFFGSSLALLDQNHDGRLDLTIGATGENRTGAITTLRGSGTRFTTSGSRTITLTTLGYRYPTNARFGASLPNNPAI